MESAKEINQKRVTVVEKIMGINERLAVENRAMLDDARIFSLNIMASPGAGKTSLIERTIKSLRGQFSIAVIDGDIATSIDADRAADAGAVAVQINTGGECHLDAVMVGQGLSRLELSEIDLLIVENVGNLVCPASFQLGCHNSVLVASIPEGDDKPYKYPGMYRGVDALVINKIDLMPYVTFDMDYFKRGVEILNPGVQTFPISCRTNEGMERWLDWVRANVLERKAESQGR
jgi:hydrogenase nickel incorporation protein HypB